MDGNMPPRMNNHNEVKKNLLFLNKRLIMRVVKCEGPCSLVDMPLITKLLH